jgi:hypothetical protein
MTESTPTATLAAAIARLQAELPTVRKDQVAKVGTYSYRYAGLEAVHAALLPLMSSLGLVWTCSPTLANSVFCLEYRLTYAPTGESITGWYPLNLPANAPAQAVGSAISYARRYTLTAVTGLVCSDDDDGRAASAQTKTARRTAVTDAGEPLYRTNDQSKKLFALLREARLTERSEVLAYVSAALGREVDTTKTLTKTECGQVIDALEAALAEPTHEERQP